MKKQNKEYKAEIPSDIKILFGRFYVISFSLIIFFGGLYPFVFINKISMISKIGLLVVLTLLYVFVIIDVIQKRQKYNSTIFVLLILLVFASLAVSIVKLVI